MTMPRTRRNQVGRVGASHVFPYDLWARICSLLDVHSAHALVFCCRWLFWNAEQLLRPLNVRVEHLEPLYWSVQKLRDLECILPPLLHSPRAQRPRRPPKRWAEEMPCTRPAPALMSQPAQPPHKTSTSADVPTCTTAAAEARGTPGGTASPTVEESASTKDLPAACGPTHRTPPQPTGT